MATNLLTNLHSAMQTQAQKSDLMQNIMQKIGDISAKMPSLLGNIEGVVQSQYLQLRKRVGKRLRKDGKTSRLALRFLGWRTFEDLLDAALNGQKFHRIV